MKKENLKFGQRVEAKATKNGEWEKAIFLDEKDGSLSVCLEKDRLSVWIDPDMVRTAHDRWTADHKAEIRQRRWRKAAEKRGMTLQEYVYALERRKARAEARRDANAKKREYWRKRQQAHREKKVETDGE